MRDEFSAALKCLLGIAISVTGVTASRFVCVCPAVWYGCVALPVNSVFASANR